MSYAASKENYQFRCWIAIWNWTNATFFYLWYTGQSHRSRSSTATERSTDDDCTAHGNYESGPIDEVTDQDDNGTVPPVYDMVRVLPPSVGHCTHRLTTIPRSQNCDEKPKNCAQPHSPPPVSNRVASVSKDSPANHRVARSPTDVVPAIPVDKSPVQRVDAGQTPSQLREAQSDSCRCCCHDVSRPNSRLSMVASEKFGNLSHSLRSEREQDQSEHDYDVCTNGITQRKSNGTTMKLTGRYRVDVLFTCSAY